MQIIDNFFEDPYRIRKAALDSKEWYNHSTWPGYRSIIPEIICKEYLQKIESILNEEVYPADLKFQYVDKSWGNGTCHCDNDKYTVLTFLSPSPPPNSGIEIYNEKQDHDNIQRMGYKIGEFESTKKRYYDSERNPIQRFFFEKKAKELNSSFGPPCIIPNVFNRTVIFNSERVHRAQNFFGNTLRDSRLTIIGFLKYDKNPFTDIDLSVRH
tara:strand:+ start:44 stop:679 length:636 start_codon:yes stop_codon:yes gene_type:complete